MKVTKEQQEKNSVKLTITGEAESFEKGVQKAYLKNVKKIALPGFRKGKAPRKIIEQYYGAGVFFEDAINFVCPEAYEEALKEAKRKDYSIKIEAVSTFDEALKKLKKI